MVAATTPSPAPDTPTIACAMTTMGMPLTGLMEKSLTVVAPVSMARRYHGFVTSTALMAGDTGMASQNDGFAVLLIQMLM